MNDLKNSEKPTIDEKTKETIKILKIVKIIAIVFLIMLLSLIFLLVSAYSVPSKEAGIIHWGGPTTSGDCTLPPDFCSTLCEQK